MCSSDLDQVVNGGFETAFTAGVPGAGWAKSSGATLSRLTSGAHEGSARLQVSGAGEYATYDLQAAAGETLTFSAAAQVTLSSGSGAAEILCRNLTTGRWLNSAFAWQAAETPWLRAVTAAFVALTGRAQVESYAACQVDRPVLRFYLRVVGPASLATFDAVHVWPRTSFVSVHGHSFPPACVVGVRSGPLPTAPTTRATLSVAQPSMWARFTGVDDRYLRFASTTPPDARQVAIRELVVGDARVLEETYEQGAQMVGIDVQERSSSDIGHLRAITRAQTARRRLACDFKLAGPAQLEAWREIMARSRNGAHPLVVVPDSTRSDAAMLCTVAPEWQTAQLRGQFQSSSVQFEELPFPSLTS